MRGIFVKFAGDATEIDWGRETTDQVLVIQKYLMNIATEHGSDFVFEDRGTDILKSAIGGMFIDASSTSTEMEFASTDTLYFCSYEEYADIYTADWYISQISINTAEYDNETQTASFLVTLTFRDGSVMETSTIFTVNGQY